MSRQGAPKPKKTPLLITTSWDDGHKLDTRLAALLTKYGIKGTFYISPHDREFPQEQLLTSPEIVAISKRFEIGAHTMTHPVLTRVPLAEATREIATSRTYLAKLTKQPVNSFCYPRGAYNDALKQAARNAGFTSARTVERHQYTVGSDAFAVPTTIHCYRHWSDPLLIARVARYNPFTFLRYYLDWEPLAQAMFDHALETGGVFHLWGHSWEIDRNGDWERLERVLAYISNHSAARYCTNDETFRHASGIATAKSIRAPRKQ